MVTSHTVNGLNNELLHGKIIAEVTIIVCIIVLRSHNTPFKGMPNPVFIRITASMSSLTLVSSFPVVPYFDTLKNS